MSQDQGWQPPSSPQPGSSEGTEDQKWARPGTDPVPPPAPATDWSRPGQPATAPPPPPQGWGQPGQGWGPAAGGWGPPPVAKPGVVALRPLGVGELLDGAVATLRQNPGPMLGLSAIVATGTQLVQLLAAWLLVRDTAAATGSLSDTGEELDAAAVSGSLVVTGLAGLLGWLATIVLTGILTVVVSRAVLGQKLRAAEAWRAASPRLLRLLGLTLLVGLIIVSPAVVTVLLSLLAWALGASGAVVAVVAVLLGLVALLLTVWLYVRLAVATPALMVETTALPGGGSRASTVVGAIRRSNVLVKGAWWRTFGILLLALIITFVVSQVVAVPAAVPLLVGGPFVAPDGTPTFAFFVVRGLAGMLATTLTAPFTAALTVLLYVDRRIRREGLDIELARAAGVSIPGRSDAPRPPA